MADDLARPVNFSLSLTDEDVSLLLGALEGYVTSWHEHYLADGGATHSVEDWERVRVTTGHLLWRIGEAVAPPGQAPVHGLYAIKPPPDEDGGAGVREPRKPRPPTPSATSALSEPGRG